MQNRKVQWDVPTIGGALIRVNSNDALRASAYPISASYRVTLKLLFVFGYLELIINI
jgi:hypothetical protein